MNIGLKHRFMNLLKTILDPNFIKKFHLKNELIKKKLSDHIFKVLKMVLFYGNYYNWQFAEINK